jgi:pimeloyl-ACP methyl ester carboxylesterase
MYPAGRRDVAVRTLVMPDGLRVRAVECGPADGTPVLFVHGWNCSVYTFRKNYLSVAAGGCRVMAADLRGHGLSDKPLRRDAYTVDALAAHVLDIMDAFGARRATLVGHSMGGAIAARVALRAPERVDRLVLLAPVGFGEASLMSVMKLLTPAAIAPVLPHLIRRWTVALGLRLAYHDARRVDGRDVDEYWAPTQFPEFVHAMREVVHAFRWDAVTEDELRRLLTPTLVMFGTGDRFVNPDRAEALARALPHGRCELVPNTGHVLPEEAPDRVNGAILDFLRSAAAA